MPRSCLCTRTSVRMSPIGRTRRGRSLPGQDSRQAGLRRHGSHLRYGPRRLQLERPGAAEVAVLVATRAPLASTWARSSRSSSASRPAPQVMRDHGMNRPHLSQHRSHIGRSAKTLGVPETPHGCCSPSPAWPAGRAPTHGVVLQHQIFARPTSGDRAAGVRRSPTARTRTVRTSSVARDPSPWPHFLCQ